MVKRLLAEHTVEEVITHIDRLFVDGAIASWCYPPYDLGTLVKHFDKLAPIPPARPRGSGPRTESTIATAEEVGLTVL